MKKIFALMIALMMILSCAAFAEESVNVEALYEGTWITFPDDGFELYLPNDWIVIELPEEVLETGIYYAIASPDGAMTVQVAWGQLDALVDAAALHADISTAYPSAQLLTMGETEMVCFANADADILAFAMPDPADPGMYVFNFTPASSEELQVLATMIMTSMRPISE